MNSFFPIEYEDKMMKHKTLKCLKMVIMNTILKNIMKNRRNNNI